MGSQIVFTCKKKTPKKTRTNDGLCFFLPVNIIIAKSLIQFNLENFMSILSYNAIKLKKLRGQTKTCLTKYIQDGHPKGIESG